MIFADKLIQLRKKSGWSQEELAQQMGVSRQAVSKWEGAQSVPELEKILQLSKLFGVSTDYLLKDELEESGTALVLAEDAFEDRKIHRVSLEEAQNFLTLKQQTAGKIAVSVFLWIISPVCLLLLGAVSSKYPNRLSENAAGGIGMVILLLVALAATALSLLSGSKTRAFAYLDNESIETEYGVTGMVKEQQSRYKDAYTRRNIIGVVACISSLIPLFGGVIFSEDVLFMVVMLAFMFLIAGGGAALLTYNGIIWASFEKLLEEGEYSRREKRRSGLLSAVSMAYWMAATAIYLAISLPTKAWEISWIVWAVAGVLYPGVLGVIKALTNQKK